MARAKKSPTKHAGRRTKSDATRTASNRPTRTKSASRRPAKQDISKKTDQTKTAQMVELLHRSKGATLAELMAATGWQAHSVRGFLSGTVRKRLDQVLKSEIVDGERRYRIDADRKPQDVS